MYGHHHTSRRKKNYAARLRNKLTPAEAALWEMLRGDQLAASHWRSQAPVFGWIADFYCAKHRLIVEVDGSIHSLPKQAEYDKWRESILNHTYKFRVLRFTNHQVLHEPASVRKALLAIVTRPRPPYIRNPRPVARKATTV